MSSPPTNPPTISRARRILAWIAVYLIWATLFTPGWIYLSLTTLVNYRPGVRWTGALWGRSCVAVLRLVGGVSIRYEGFDDLPRPVLVASRHQSWVDAMALSKLLNLPAFILKASLKRLPIVAKGLKRSGSIFISRAQGMTALRAIKRDANVAMQDRVPILIFPEGHRFAPGKAPEKLQPGVFFLYSLLKLPCAPVVLNTGQFYTRAGLPMHKGTAVVRRMAMIPPGLNREDFMRTLHERLDEGSRALEAAPEYAQPKPWSWRRAFAWLTLGLAVAAGIIVLANALAQNQADNATARLSQALAQRGIVAEAPVTIAKITPSLEARVLLALPWEARTQNDTIALTLRVDGGLITRPFPWRETTSLALGPLTAHAPGLTLTLPSLAARTTLGGGEGFAYAERLRLNDDIGALVARDIRLKWAPESAIATGFTLTTGRIGMEFVDAERLPTPESLTLLGRVIQDPETLNPDSIIAIERLTLAWQDDLFAIQGEGELNAPWQGALNGWLRLTFADPEAFLDAMENSGGGRGPIAARTAGLAFRALAALGERKGERDGKRSVSLLLRVRDGDVLLGKRGIGIGTIAPLAIPRLPRP